MNIIVAIKQVPDTNDVKIDPATGTLIREGVPSIVNPEDRHAVELGLSLREAAGGGKVTIITMGPPQAEAALRETLAMGADEAVLLSDRAFAGADTLATAAALCAAVKKLDKFDVIICGRQAIDGDTAQVGPQLAEFLSIPQITYVRKVELVKGGLRVERAIEGGYQVLESPFPVLLTCLKELNHPRIPSLPNCIAAYREKPYHVWNAADVSAPVDRIGLKGSPTQVRKTFTPPPKGAGQVLTGDPAANVRKVIDLLRDRNVL